MPEVCSRWLKYTLMVRKLIRYAQRGTRDGPKVGIRRLRCLRNAQDDPWLAEKRRK
jgi:hypothetical protein